MPYSAHGASASWISTASRSWLRVEAVEAHTVALNRIGGNLNQITAAINRGTVPERAETVLDRVEQAAQNSFHLIDQLLANGTAHGS